MIKKVEKMSFNATWSMAVGGMIGGGIFSVLGVVLNTAGQWAWLSFLIAGIIALISAYSYSKLAFFYKKSGGAYTFLYEINYKSLAGSLAWILILGYILTISVYAFTFGHYVAHLLNLGNWFPRVLAFTIISVLTLINLRGISDLTRLEIFIVWGKLFALLGLALFGVINWQPEQLIAGIEPKSWYFSIIGVATIFMAYEGFQLLFYDYNDVNNPQKTLPRAIISAVIAVIIIYILVTLGGTMLVGAKTIIQNKEIALSIAGEQALGIYGLILITIAAAFSTASAINATLFSTGRLMQSVAQKKDLPKIFIKENQANIPYQAILLIAFIATLFAMIGSLEELVDAASIIFLITFGSVNLMAYKQKVKAKIVCLIGFIGCLIAIIVSSYVRFQENPIPLILIYSLILIVVFGRMYVFKRLKE